MIQENNEKKNLTFLLLYLQQINNDIPCEKRFVIIVVNQNERKRKEANIIIILFNHLFKIFFC